MLPRTQINTCMIVLANVRLIVLTTVISSKKILQEVLQDNSTFVAMSTDLDNVYMLLVIQIICCLYSPGFVQQHFQQIQ